MAYNTETSMYEGFIYKIWNEVNDKIYIGQTKATIKQRWHGHMSSALNEKRNKSALYNAMRKHGRDKFHIEEIDKIEDISYDSLTEKLDELEILRIYQYNSYTWGNGYNCEYGGTGKRKRISGRHVCKYDDDLNLLETYDSLQWAGTMNNIDGATIWSVCHHYYYRAGGFVWAYEGEEPVKPPILLEQVKEVKPKVEKPKKEKKVVVELSAEEKRIKYINDCGLKDEKIIQYNAYGEIIHEYSDAIDAIKSIPITMCQLRKNLNGENLMFNKTVIRYESVPFDYYKMSQYLQPVVLYDLQGNYVNRFQSRLDAEKYLGVPSGEISKVLKRGGSVKGHLVSEYGKDLVRKIMRIEHTYEMLSDDYMVIKTFNKYEEISEMFGLKDCSQSLLKAIRNKTKYRGYYWRFKEEFQINSV